MIVSEKFSTFKKSLFRKTKFPKIRMIDFKNKELVDKLIWTSFSLELS
jgi:hypothetical protein